VATVDSVYFLREGARKFQLGEALYTAARGRALRGFMLHRCLKNSSGAKRAAIMLWYWFGRRAPPDDRLAAFPGGRRAGTLISSLAAQREKKIGAQYAAFGMPAMRELLIPLPCRRPSRSRNCCAPHALGPLAHARYAKISGPTASFQDLRINSLAIVADTQTELILRIRS